MNYLFTVFYGVILFFLVIGFLTTIPVFGQEQSEIDIKPETSSTSASCADANNCFSPNPLKVPQGTTVTWKNLDSISHTITSLGNQCNAPHFTIEVETDNKKVDPTVLVRTSLTDTIYAKLAQYQPYAADNVISPIRKLVYEAYVSPVSKSFEVVVVEGIGHNTYSVHKTVQVSGCDVGSLFDSGAIQPEKRFEFTFSTTGNYNYFCKIHPWMTGNVLVESIASGKSLNSVRSSTIDMSNTTSSFVIPEFPVSTVFAMMIGFGVLLLLRLSAIMKKTG